jgi:hypothetical protein
MPDQATSLPPEIVTALVQATTLIIGGAAAYIVQRIAHRQKLIGRGVEQGNDQNEALCLMIRANTKLCEEIAERLKAMEAQNAESGAH